MKIGGRGVGAFVAARPGVGRARSAFHEESPGVPRGAAVAAKAGGIGRHGRIAAPRVRTGGSNPTRRRNGARRPHPRLILSC
jgi:hypothetical protein